MDIDHVLTTLLIILVLLWVIGTRTTFTVGALLHALLLIVLVIVVSRALRRTHPWRT